MSVATQELLLTASDALIEAAVDKTPAVNILAYSRGLMAVPGWWKRVIDLAGIDVSASQVSIPADHDATLGGVIGFGRAMVFGGKLLVAGTIAPTTEAAFLDHHLFERSVPSRASRRRWKASQLRCRATGDE
jgi:hypothetical protein